MSTPEDELYGLLKGAAEAPGEANPVDGENSVVEEPEKRESGTVAAPWGEPGPQVNGIATPAQLSEAAAAIAQEARHGTVDRVLAGHGAATKEDLKLMSENFEHVSSGDFQTHSLQLGDKQKVKIAHPREGTLAERVHALLGRY